MGLVLSSRVVRTSVDAFPGTTRRYLGEVPRNNHPTMMDRRNIPRLGHGLHVALPFPPMVDATSIFTEPSVAFQRRLQVNKGIDSTILLRDVINGNSVEHHIPLYSPLIQSVEVSCSFGRIFNGSTLTMLLLYPMYASGCTGCAYRRFSSLVRPIR